MTLQEFIKKIETDKDLHAKVNAEIMDKVILPMAQANGIELTDEELLNISGGSISKPSTDIKSVK